MEFKLASERPSEVMGAKLSNDISHRTTFGGKRPNVRDQNRVSGSCISFNIDFLSCHFKDHLGLLDGDRYLRRVGVGHCRQNPGAASVVWHGHLRIRSPSPPLGPGTVPLPVTCLFTDWAWTWGHFLAFMGTVASWLAFEAFCLAGFSSR